jgi:hypothetical protein
MVFMLPMLCAMVLPNIAPRRVLFAPLFRLTRLMFVRVQSGWATVLLFTLVPVPLVGATLLVVVTVLCTDNSRIPKNKTQY